DTEEGGAPAPGQHGRLRRSDASDGGTIRPRPSALPNPAAEPASYRRPARTVKPGTLETLRGRGWRGRPWRGSCSLAQGNRGQVGCVARLKIASPRPAPPPAPRDSPRYRAGQASVDR